MIIMIVYVRFVIIFPIYIWTMNKVIVLEVTRGERTVTDHMIIIIMKLSQYYDNYDYMILYLIIIMTRLLYT